jgi:hypothetical protein
MPEDTNFTFAFIDFDMPPTLDPGSFLDADFDEDGSVDADDLAAWEGGFGSGTTKAQGDADADSDVDGADFLAWQRQFGSAPPASVAAGAIPEPSALALAGVGALALAGLCRRKGQSKS